MVIENQPVPLAEWLFSGTEGHLFLFLRVVVLAVVLGSLVGFLVTTFRRGPGEAFFRTAKVIFAGVTDLVGISFRRTFAMAWLAFQESIRKRVLVAFGIFVLLLLFGGWYLDVSNDEPARLYISFVLTATNFLVLMLALFLSAFSLPADIQSRTIETVVTKPVRAVEIVLGRIIGFAGIGTVLLTIMGVASYVFVTRGLAHSHQIEDGSMTSAPARSGAPTQRGATTSNSGHRHEVTFDADGRGRIERQMGHEHTVTPIDGGAATAAYQVSPPRNMLQARIPLYAKRLHFLDRLGGPTDIGINVGDMWEYRSYVEGGTAAAAIWTFEGITPERFENGLPLELTLGVFRTYKGDIEKVIGGTVMLRNPDVAAQRVSARIAFDSQEFVTQQIVINRKLPVLTPDGRRIEGDLFKDLVNEQGEIEIWIRCSDRQQYFGMARPDLYLKAGQGSFAANFAKGYVTIWMQMILVVCFGVTFSTFLSGAVAMLATLSTMILGYFSKFINEVATGELMGGGPIESFYRLITQMNVTLEMDKTPAVVTVKWVDARLMDIMETATAMLPDYRGFSENVSYVAYGFNIPELRLMVPQLLTTLAFVIGLSCVGYFLLKTREVGA